MGNRSPKPLRLPVVPLSGAVLYPGAIVTTPCLDRLPIAALRAAREARLTVLVVGEGADGLADFGTIAQVTGAAVLPTGESALILRGLGRARVLGYAHTARRSQALVEPFSDRPPLRGATLVRAVKLAVARLLVLRSGEGVRAGGPRLGAAAAAPVPDDPSALGFHAAALLSLPFAEQLRHLATQDPAARLRRLVKDLAREEEALRLAARVRDRASLHVQEAERRQLLKEQVRLLQEELGEDGDGATELGRLKAELAALDLPPAAREAVSRELDRMEMMPAGSPDYLISYAYLAWIKELPWGQPERPTPPTLASARRQLNRQHFGLGAVKERILEYLAVMRLKGDTRGEILLLAGPPGVGKSTLARQIAAALGRPFAQVALGGVRDEAEIRGHRRTYVGAMPGKLLHAIRQTRSNAPVILLDEIDKVGLDHGRGALSSALLEVLDYGQNHAFVDHYLAVPYDLSNVLFIATANDPGALSGPLRDRMELIELPSYTEPEKLAIAQRHLIPELTRELGLKPTQLRLPEPVVRQVVRLYTREAGVRQLRRELAALGRKTVRALAENRAPPALTSRSLAKLLGPPRYPGEPNDARLAPGVALGLAWTEAGGDILYIESTRVPAPNGRGELQLTGHLGKVMKESAQAALAYLRTLAYEHPELLPDPDSGIAGLAGSLIHLHLPAGATPKDGPSAGLAIVCAIASLLTGKALPAKLALTGEITLRGQVLAVGGLKEKLLAAHRYGKTRVVVPAGNLHDLEALPREVRRELEIIPVQTMQEALIAVELLRPAATPARPLRLAAPVARQRAAGRPQ